MARLILIEDDHALRDCIALSLRAAGHEVTLASDGATGTELARLFPVDLLITDLVMPGQEAMETIRILRKEHPQLPIVAISGDSPHSELYLDIARKIGADAALAKPFTLEELHTTIRRLLEASPPRPPSPAPAA
ncbi:MAG: response regulator [Verrucomicrobia bacterium]|nr:response regulator [Verrucomicrobiota bacterium]